jgi:hypothetical protein
MVNVRELESKKGLLYWDSSNYSYVGISTN